MFLVVGIGEDFEQVLVARRAAAVFGWAAADGVEQQDVGLALDPWRDLFELDGVGPAVAEVVEVAEGLAAGVRQNGAQAGFLASSGPSYRPSGSGSPQPAPPMRNS